MWFWHLWILYKPIWWSIVLDIFKKGFWNVSKIIRSVLFLWVSSSNVTMKITRVHVKYKSFTKVESIFSLYFTQVAHSSYSIWNIHNIQCVIICILEPPVQCMFSPVSNFSECIMMPYLIYLSDLCTFTPVTAIFHHILTRHRSSLLILCWCIILDDNFHLFYFKISSALHPALTPYVICCS